MSQEEFERKLAAVFYADVAGYSRLMGQDEDATVTALNECRAIFRDRPPMWFMPVVYLRSSDDTYGQLFKLE